MNTKASANRIVLRPHFKTHQSIEIGGWMRDEGISRITVSSLNMALYFSAEGWDDITVAFPCNILEIDKINTLAKSGTLNLLIEDPNTITRLQKLLKFPINFFIKIDVGYHRTGIDPIKTELIDDIITRSHKGNNTTFNGFLGHAGHSYKCRSITEILAVHNESMHIMNFLMQRYIGDHPNLQISLGDTPTCSVATDFGPATEIRPGNYVFYDLAQEQIGACNMSDMALTMACPIVAIHPDRGNLVIYGGGVHFAKDNITVGGKTIFGIVLSKITDKPAYNDRLNYLSSLSQEHGVIEATPELIAKKKVGDIVYIRPIHACMTANLMKAYTSTDGNIIPRL